MPETVRHGRATQVDSFRILPYLVLADVGYQGHEGIVRVQEPLGCTFGARGEIQVENIVGAGLQIVQAIQLIAPFLDNGRQPVLIAIARVTAHYHHFFKTGQVRYQFPGHGRIVKTLVFSSDNCDICLTESIEIFQIPLAEYHMQWLYHRAYAGQCQLQKAKFQPVGKLHRDNIALGYANADQSSSQRVRLLFELPEAVAAIIGNDGN